MATTSKANSRKSKSSAAKTWVYRFADVDKAEAYCDGSWDGVRSLLGGKGANLAEMTRIGVSVPPGFTVTTEACNAYSKNGGFPEDMWEQVLEALKSVEEATGKKFGDEANPLLVSVRSGAKFSMPGMMDTVLNLGLNDKSAEGMVKLTNDERFVFDSYRRLVQMFGTVVMNIEDEAFEDYLTEAKKEYRVKTDAELSAEAWKTITEEFKSIYKKAVGEDFPQDPFKQLELAIEAVFKSWNGKRAVDYRNAAHISHDLGTGVNVQTMVFGNMGQNSGTGVAFTREPATGESVLFGDYLINAQGEDVVAGIRTPSPIAKLKEEMPKVYDEFLKIVTRLEKHYREMQDVEFTIEQGKLYMLQTRDGKRTARSAIRIAVEMADEGLISKQEAILRVTPEQVSQLLHPQFDIAAKQAAEADGRLIGHGVNASPGAAVGVAAFDADLAEKWGKAGKDVIMVRPETKPDDVHGMLSSKGILTSRGGATSHAAVVARQFGVPCVAGAEGIDIDVRSRVLTAGDVKIREGEVLSIDGGAGEVFIGEIPTVEPDFEREQFLQKLLGWADEFRRLSVYANADYPADARRAREYGARGIGLCRTEHMFFEGERIVAVREMILSETEQGRRAALDKLLPMQRGDFTELFEIMQGLPVTIRLLDPPLHEFLPHSEEEIAEVAAVMGVDSEVLRQRAHDLNEFNPMLGHRGCRLLVTYPEIAEMQARAIFEGAVAAGKTTGAPVTPEIMVPLVGVKAELDMVRARIDAMAKAVAQETGITIDYQVGTMIELPRACLRAGEIAETAEFFSFGTNDLTQTTFGISRDDAASFLGPYQRMGVIERDPFVSLDQEGVGELIRIGAERGRAARPGLKLGICGEHGGDPASITFCESVGLDYVSCSPFRVPIARLAAAQAALKAKKAA
jgi:pyruvate,orthophosphate dikinase